MSRSRAIPLLCIVGATGLLGGTAAAADPSPAPSENGAAWVPGAVVGPGLSGLLPVEGAVTVLASGAVPLRDPAWGQTTRIVAIVGNGTDGPVDVSAAWAATGADGELVWAGHLADGSSAVNGILGMGAVADAVPPGGVGLLMDSEPDLAPDLAMAFAARGEPADDPDPGDPRIHVTAAAVADGRVVGEVQNVGQGPAERQVRVIAACVDGTRITTARGVVVDLDQPLEALGSVPFEVDLVGQDCPGLVVGAEGS
jgi:hypothetical protein